MRVARLLEVPGGDVVVGVGVRLRLRQARGFGDAGVQPARRRRDDGGDAGVVHHGAHALRRIQRVQRQVCGARHLHGQQRRQHLGPALQVHAHHAPAQVAPVGGGKNGQRPQVARALLVLVRVHQRRELPRQRAGAGSEAAVGPALAVLQRHRYGVGGGGGGSQHQRRQREAAAQQRGARGGGVPGVLLAELAGGDERDGVRPWSLRRPSEGLIEVPEARRGRR
mmetsp:Transcript_15674/g.38042  ORF Transcript_15674/g.38042 Transcript_15674/m.38042 type:complete len:224 (+) Transcript_15674:1188-1859(+)